jgi:hypothetical protein
VAAGVAGDAAGDVPAVAGIARGEVDEFESELARADVARDPELAGRWSGLRDSPTGWQRRTATPRSSSSARFARSAPTSAHRWPRPRSSSARGAPPNRFSINQSSLFERLAQVPDAVKQPRVALDHDVNRGMFLRSRRKDSLGRGGRSQASACPFARLVAISHGIKVSGANQYSSCANGRMASGHYRRSSIASGCDA